MYIMSEVLVWRIPLIPPPQKNNWELRSVTAFFISFHRLYKVSSAAIMPFDLITGKFIPEKSNIWRDCVDGYYDWTKEHIAEGAPLNEADHCGDPPLLLAAGNGHLACVKLLVNEGADLEQRGMMKETPLSRAAHNGHFHTVKYLIEEGAELDPLDLGDNTPMHWAAMRGHVEIVKYLLESGADKTLKNKQERLPIDNCQACWSNSWRYVRELLADD